MKAFRTCLVGKEMPRESPGSVHAFDCRVSSKPGLAVSLILIQEGIYLCYFPFVMVVTSLLMV